MTDLTHHTSRERIRDFQFRPMFNELGWDHFPDELAVPVDGTTYRLRGVAHKRGLVVYLLETAELPDGPLRNKIETQVARSRREHILIFADEAHTRQVWLWALREIGRPLARRSFDYHAGQATGRAVLLAGRGREADAGRRGRPRAGGVQRGAGHQEVLRRL